MAKQGTCWDGYVQKGMKMKNGKMVPNCVPASSATTRKKKTNANKKSKVKG